MIVAPSRDGNDKDSRMNIYSGPVFEMARQQFEVIADHIGMPEDQRDRMLYPKRAISVSCPIHLDDGSTKVFQGYRVQHHLTLGPTKGGTRFSPSVDIGEVAALRRTGSHSAAGMLGATFESDRNFRQELQPVPTLQT